jgi:hypothetical protein
MNPIVHIVHHVDTEGPLYESVAETFKRIVDILGKEIPLIPNEDNLKKLQNGEVDFLEKNDVDKIKIITNAHLLLLL